MISCEDIKWSVHLLFPQLYTSLNISTCHKLANISYCTTSIMADLLWQLRVISSHHLLPALGDLLDGFNHRIDWNIHDLTGMEGNNARNKSYLSS